MFNGKIHLVFCVCIFWSFFGYAKDRDLDALMLARDHPHRSTKIWKEGGLVVLCEQVGESTMAKHLMVSTVKHPNHVIKQSMMNELCLDGCHRKYSFFSFFRFPRLFELEIVILKE